MSPEELRAAADKVHVSEPFYAEACRRLADVIEYVELREWASEHGAYHIGSVRVYQTSEETVDHVGRIARRGMS